jgi:hypothetical protein
MSLPKVITEGRQALTKEAGVLLKTAEAVGAAGAVVVTVEKRLATNLLHQEQPEWCWASVAKCIADAYHDGPAEQCQIATTVLNRQCCTGVIDKECNVQHPLSLALKNNFVRFHAGLDDKGAPFDFPFVKSFIDGHKPLPAHISYPSTGHYVVITGYREEPRAKLVFVRDPANADNVLSAVDFTQFLNAYKFFGKWDVSYETKGAQPPSEA